MTRTVFHLRNVLVLIGILVAGIGIVFFATEFIDRISEWGRLASLVLLAVMCTALARHFEHEEAGSQLVARRGWRWLRVTTALYLLGLTAALAAVIVFMGIEAIDRLIRVAIAIVLGLAIVVFGARRAEAPPAEEQAASSDAGASAQAGQEPRNEP